MALCKCGCNQETKKGRDYIFNHHFRGMKRTEEQKKKLSELASKRTGESNPFFGKKHTEETRLRMKEAWTEERKHEYSLNHGGANNHMFGTHTSDKQKEAVRVALKGKPRPQEVKDKIRNAHIGKVFTKEHKQNMKLNHVTTLSAEHKQKIGESLEGRICTPEEVAKRSGDKHYRWLGGVSFEPYCPKFNRKLKEEIRNKFNRCCVLCGVHEDITKQKHDVHHIDYNKGQGCNGHDWRLVPLCKSCHTKTNHNRELWEAKICEILNARETK